MMTTKTAGGAQVVQKAAPGLVNRLMGMFSKDNVEGLATEGVSRFMQSKPMSAAVNALGRGNVNKGMFGPDVAARARQHGIAFLTGDAINTTSGLGRLVQMRPGMYTITDPRQLPQGFQGVVINASGRRMPRNTPYQVVGQSAHRDNKFLEARLMQRLGAGPRTESVRHLVTKYRLNPQSRTFRRDFANALDQEFKGRWIMKDIYGAASHGMPTDISRNPRLFRSRNDDVMRGMVQERYDIAPVTDMEKWLHRPGNMFADHQHAGKGNAEYRVHMINGQPVAAGTLGRGSLLRNLTSLPTSRTRQAEEFARQTFAKMEGNPRAKGIYGLDVGFRTDGKPFMIEMNPSSGMYLDKTLNKWHGGYSGYLQRPGVAEASMASVMGRKPYTQTALTVAGGTAAGAAGTAGVAGSVLGNDNDTNKSPYAGLKNIAGSLMG